MSTSPFTAVTSLQPAGDGVFTAHLDESWAQGRAAFGGVVAGWGVRALEGLVAADRGLRVATVEFVGPVAPGDVQVEARILRTGSALTRGEARITQGDRLCAVVLASYGADRPTALAHSPERLESIAGSDWPALPYVEGLTPTFTQHYQYRMDPENLPFSQSTEARLAGAVRHAVPTPVGAPELLGLLDAWPAAVLALADRPVPSSSVSWMITVHTPPPPGGWPGDAWFGYRSLTPWSTAGYADLDAALYGPDGALLASSRQLVVEFSRRS